MNAIDRLELRLTRILRALLRPVPPALETLVDAKGIVPRAPLTTLGEANAHDDRWHKRRDEWRKRLNAVQARRQSDRKLLTNGYSWKWMPQQTKVVPINRKSRRVA